jgi:hypothetical protein
MEVPAQSAHCKGPRPSSVTAEVFGPDGALVPSDVSLSEGTPAEGTLAELRFTPLQPGPYHVLVAFSPVGGIHQFDFHAAQDRSAEAASLTLPEPCSSLERTLQGAWVCGTKLFRDGTAVAEFPEARLAVSGDVVWVVDETQTRRFVDTGSALVQTHAVNRPPGRVGFLLPSADELLALQHYSLRHRLLLHYTAGTELTVASTLIESVELGVGPVAPAGVILRDADQILVLTMVDCGCMRLIAFPQACSYQLTPTGPQRTQAPCLNPAPDGVVGFERGALWTGYINFTTGDGVISRWTWAAGRFEKQSSLRPKLNSKADFVSPPSTFNGPSVVPVLRSIPSLRYPDPITTVVTWSPARQQIVLEQLDPDISEVSASPSFYWGRVPPLTSNTATRVRIRPPTP